MSAKSLASALLVGAIVAGCANDKKDPATGLTPNETAQMRSAKNKFESSEDPPITADTHFAAGQLAEAQGDLSKAEKQYLASLKQEPKHQKSLYALAMLYTRQRNFPDAIDVWKRYVKATDGSASAWNNLAYTDDIAGKADDAESAYKKAISKDSGYQNARVNFGLMLARHGRINEATIQLQAVLSSAEVHYDLASIYEQQGHKEQARAEYKKSLESDANFKDAAERLASLQ